MKGEVGPEGEKGKGGEGTDQRAREQFESPVLGALRSKRKWTRKTNEFDPAKREADFDREVAERPDDLAAEELR